MIISSNDLCFLRILFYFSFNKIRFLCEIFFGKFLNLKITFEVVKSIWFFEVFKNYRINKIMKKNPNLTTFYDNQLSAHIVL